MSKVMVFIGATVGGWIGWFAAERFGFMTAFIVSIFGTAIGVYVGRRLADELGA